MASFTDGGFPSLLLVLFEVLLMPLRYMAWKIRAEQLCDCVIVCTFIKCMSCSQNFMLLYLYFGRHLLIGIKSQLLNKMHVSSCSFNLKSVIELEDGMTFSYRDSYVV